MPDQATLDARRLAPVERRWMIAMSVVYVVGAAIILYMLGREDLWREGWLVPIMALGIAWLFFTPATLAWYLRHCRAAGAASATADPDELRRETWRRELYWWVGEGPVVGAAVAAVFTGGAVAASAYAAILDGMPILRAAFPLGFLVVAGIVMVPVALRRIRWLRRSLGTDAHSGREGRGTLAP